MRYPLPYAFARTAQLLLEDDSQQLLLCHGPAPDASALSEVLRRYAHAPPALLLQTVDAQTLPQRISTVYAQG